MRNLADNKRKRPNDIFRQNKRTNIIKFSTRCKFLRCFKKNRTSPRDGVIPSGTSDWSSISRRGKSTKGTRPRLIRTLNSRGESSGANVAGIVFADVSCRLFRRALNSRTKSTRVCFVPSPSNRPFVFVTGRRSSRLQLPSLVLEGRERSGERNSR